MQGKPPKLPEKCNECGRPASEVKIYLSNYKCQDCMRAYSKRRYELRKQGLLVQTGPSRPRWDVVKVILDPSHEWIWADGHWQEYDRKLHGTLVGVTIIEKAFDEMH